jgi:hypothetical protein
MTVALAVPLGAEAIRIQLTSVEAVQAHPVSVLKFAFSCPPLAPIEPVAGVQA